MSLDRTTIRHRVLDRVAEGDAVFHSGLFGQVLGFAWKDGSRPYPGELDALFEFHDAGLIVIGAPSVTGNPVGITTEGVRLLAEYNATIPVTVEIGDLTPVEVAALDHVKRHKVVHHSPIHDDGTGFQLLDADIDPAEQAALEALADAQLIHVADPAVSGRAVEIDAGGLELLASKPARRRAA